jgi:hypothetical protein
MSDDDKQDKHQRYDATGSVWSEMIRVFRAVSEEDVGWYRRALTAYVNDQGIERCGAISRPKIRWIILLGLVLAGIVGYSRGAGTPPIAILELFAAFTTILLSMIFFSRLHKEVKAATHYIDGKTRVRFNVDETIMSVLVAWCVNVIISVLIILSLLQSQGIVPIFLMEAKYWLLAYVALLTISFGIFSFTDIFVAKQSLSFGMVREYWALFVFCDAPAFVGFLCTFIYVLATFTPDGWSVNSGIVSGAVFMQMAVADAIFVLVSTNMYVRILVKFCRGVDQS